MNPVQMEAIALDEDALEGVGSVSSMTVSGGGGGPLGRRVGPLDGDEQGQAAERQGGGSRCVP